MTFKHFSSEGPVKKPRREETRGATIEEVKEAMNYGMGARSGRVYNFEILDVY